MNVFDMESGGTEPRLKARWVGGGETNEFVEVWEAKGLGPPSFSACTGVCFGETGSEGVGDIVVDGASAEVEGTMAMAASEYGWRETRFRAPAAALGRIVFQAPERLPTRNACSGQEARVLLVRPLNPPPVLSLLASRSTT